MVDFLGGSVIRKNQQKKRVITLRFVVLSLVILLSAPAHPNDSPVQDVKSVIQQQLAAFNADDYDVAYQYASRDIQSVFSRSEFEMMVRTGFPQIANSRRTSFEKIDLSNDGTHAEAIVHVTGMNHVTVIVQYRLVREKGGWKNNGVVILEQITPI